MSTLGLVPPDPNAIVTFTSPPIAEVVTSVRFAPMAAELFLSVGDLHKGAWKAAFPKFEAQAPYEAPTEGFGAARPGVNPFQFSVQATPPLPRIWLTSSGDDEILQLQPGWFAANWRANAESGRSAPYPRWPARRRAFEAHWETFSGWMRAQGHDPVANQYEVTYINHIGPIDGVWNRHGDVGRLLHGLALPATVETVPEQITLRAQSIVSEGSGLPPARLHIALTPAFSATGPEPSPLLILELTVRGAPASDASLIAALDRGRRVIVETFLAMTTDEARAAWGQE